MGNPYNSFNFIATEAGHGDLQSWNICCLPNGEEHLWGIDWSISRISKKERSVKDTETPKKQTSMNMSSELHNQDVFTWVCLAKKKKEKKKTTTS